MEYDESDIIDMQCWVYRMAEKKWDVTPKECAELFQKYKIFDFISKCFGILHVSSYECALRDVEDILKNRGVNICYN